MVIMTGFVIALPFLYLALPGALAPTLTPVTVEALTGHLPQIVPAQIFFGPAAFAGHLVLSRRGPERRMADVRRPAPAPVSSAA
ncbi:hypothetical protein ACFVTY_10080 [Streptomyces sp. NPDC058067]|uniref:hypothetical protein n=1 Tax=Streptomyces sp. NPDC058067 TaxID=3346324 RepID=UPI0036F05D7E